MRSPILPLLSGLIAALGAGCATSMSTSGAGTLRVLQAFDDGRPDSTVIFPSAHYEGLIRFDLGSTNRPVIRAWVGMASPGLLVITLYESNSLDAPGEAIAQARQEVKAEDLFTRENGQWLVADLSAAGARGGTVWLGLRRAGGEPTIWASHVESGHYYVRSDDPLTPIDVLPVKRSPLVRLELGSR